MNFFVARQSWQDNAEQKKSKQKLSLGIAALWIFLAIFGTGAGFTAASAEPLRFAPPPVYIDPTLVAAAEQNIAQSQGQQPKLDSETGEKAAPKSPPAASRLFGHVEFRGALNNMPKWQRVLGLEKKEPSFGDKLEETLTPAVAARWLKVSASLQDASLEDKIKGVNNFFNQWPYKTDIVAWGVEDYWATPQEFVRKSGDCEDYAIAKYYALRSLGVPASQMRIVAVVEKIRGIGHAVLVVYLNDNAFVLDNLTNLILPHTQLRNYEPKFSVNEEYRWAHVKPVSQPKK